jgi:hypothetical protein
MPASRPSAMQTEAVNPDGRQALPNSSKPDLTPAQSGAGRPEWATERWKLQVEAEARSRLKRLIRNVGSER